MVEQPHTPRHTIIITQVRDETSKAKIAKALARLSKSTQADAIMKQLDRLPWTVTRKASTQDAATLTRMLNTLGAKTTVRPPLPAQTPGESVQARTSPETYVSARREPKLPDPFTPTYVKKNEPEIDTIELSAAGTEKPLPTPQTPGFSIEPLTLGGMLDKTFQVYRSNFWKLLGIALIPMLAMWALIAAIAVVAFIVGIAMGMKLDIESIKGLSGSLFVIFLILMAIVVLIVAVIAYVLARAAVIYAVSCIYLGREVRLRDVYSFALGKVAPLLLTSLLYSIFLGLVSAGSLIALSIAAAILLVPVYLANDQFAQSLGGILIIVFVIILTGAVWISVITYVILKLFLFQEVVIIENIAYTDALKRSWKLLTGKAEGPWPRGYFVRAIVLLHIFFVVYLAVYSLFWPIGELIVYLCPKSLNVLAQIVAQIVSNIGAQVAALFISVCGVIFYYDIRCCKEGFDLKMLAQMDE